MLAATTARIDAKKRAVLDSRKKQFAKATWEAETYDYRMNFYLTPPTGDIALEQFEEWAIARLKVLAELEACQFRNRSPAETEEYMRPVLEKYMRLSSNASRSSEIFTERKRDHYSHWTLRLAFSGTAELRQRFARLEAQLFRLRMQWDDAKERKEFIASLAMSWETVSEEEKLQWRAELKAATRVWDKEEEESYFKVQWENVPDLVERRMCLLKRGMAYVHIREQSGMVVNEFSRQLESALELAGRFLPRMDEDDRLSPILHHLSQQFVAPDSGYSESSSIGDITTPTAASIDGLSQHFPLCMQNLHRELRKNSHLKHFGRLQYTLFLKGIGLSLQEYKFKSEYLYNIRHSYGDVGGDANRRGKGYTPYSCQKLLTEAPPSSGQAHGCPYRTYGPDNLIALLQNVGVSDRQLLQGVREDVGKQRFHIACNRVFEHAHAAQIKKVKEESLWPASELDTILHPNTYFKRSFLLKNLGKVQAGDLGVDGPVQSSGGSERMET
ncbi:DNA primase subunit pri2 [Elasticomyces elasticus]|nr:DNA primase subunit pri2 [Elasticomyces elasticus]KAK3650600.1 DNA primase subunit pri2 [Elasticomyces elasticus]KAK4913933.1 DNA primase subunit pri2 [Elasticomyces elasticus]KAK5753097.1 DNA primase subunit pri2 [Elasticomyces elasticus]